VEIPILQYPTICRRSISGKDHMANSCKHILLSLMCIMFMGCLLAFPARAGEEETDFLYDFLIGSYEVIGRWPDSHKTYTGRVDVSHKDGHLALIRDVDGKKTKCNGRIDSLGADDIKVLRVNFNHSGNDYNGTYIIKSDLDNYGRLTGYVYLANGATRKVGLEALFSDHGQLVRGVQKTP
jgi:hypothetical protein